MGLLYGLFVHFFYLAARVSSLWSPKSKDWISGRQNWEETLKSKIDPSKSYIWIHCSSLGEFEQGRPVLEALKRSGENIILSFFSPSGYNIRKDFEHADVVCYLPLDTKRNARLWSSIVPIKAALFVKYEFWFNYIEEMHRTQVPLLLISGIFRPDQYFFSGYGIWAVKKLKFFDRFFVQNQESAELLKSVGIENVEISGDSRFDRVIELAADPVNIPEVEHFCSDGLSLIAGSTWKEDEELIFQAIESESELKAVIAPHEVNEKRIDYLMKRSQGKAQTLSNYNEDLRSSILIVDRIGLLSSMYKYAILAYIGGGFGNGIHNTLEAAVYGKALIFGHNYKKFKEAVDMVAQGGAVAINDFEGFHSALNLFKVKAKREEAGEINKKYVEANAGATNLVISFLQKEGIVKTF